MKKEMAEYLRKHPWVRNTALVITSIFFLYVVASLISSYSIFEETFLPILLLMYVPIPVFMYLFFSWLAGIHQSSELAPIRKEREEIRDRIKGKRKEPDIFDTIQLNLNQLEEYYTINKSQ